MSTSLLYHAFGVRGYRHVKTEYRKGAVIFTIEQPRESYRCPACGSRDVIGRGRNLRRFRSVPIGGKPVYLVLPVPHAQIPDLQLAKLNLWTHPGPQQSHESTACARDPVRRAETHRSHKPGLR